VTSPRAKRRGRSRGDLPRFDYLGDVRSRKPSTRVGALRRLRAAVVLGPTVVVLALDAVRRGPQLATLRLWGEETGLRGAHGLAFAASLAHGALLWSALLVVAASKRRCPRGVAATAFVATFACAVGVQWAFRSRWGTYLTRDHTELSVHALHASFGTLPLGDLLAPIVASGLAAVGTLNLARRWLRPTRRSRRVATAVATASFVAALFVPVSYRGPQATTPDLLWLHAVSFSARGPEAERVGLSSPQRREPRAPPVLVARDQREVRNVLLVLQESQRADVSCDAPTEPCSRSTVATHALTPDRLPLSQLRSNASVTTIAMGVLFTGLSPTASLEEWRTAPTLFEIAHAAGYSVAYLTSQHLSFANNWLLVQDVPGPVVLATHLDPAADLFVGADDAALADRATRELAALREPFFAVVHFANNHAPRARTAGPFEPHSEDKSDPTAYFHNYANVVARSDRAVASLLERLRATDAGARTVVLYTADHGEAMGEHDQGCDHGCSLYEEDVRVPGFVDAPPGVLSEAESSALRAARDLPTFHLDWAPTMLDLLGVHDDPALAETRARWVGASLTRPLGERGPIPLSNVSHLWERGRPSYGLTDGRLKLIGRQRDPDWSCFDLARDPREREPLDGDCGGLRAAAAKLYGGPPSRFTRVVDAERPWPRDWPRE
jgi:arylsulfatase A-like enzyme